MAATDTGAGTTISFSSTFLAEVLGLRLTGYSRQAIDTTHSTVSSGWMTNIPSDLKAVGTMEVDLNFDADDTPPLTSVPETVTITFPTPVGGSSGATFACSGYLTGFEVDVPIDDRMTATATIQFTGAPTWTDAT